MMPRRLQNASSTAAATAAAASSWKPIAAQILLFLLFLGLSGSIDVDAFKATFCDASRRNG